MNIETLKRFIPFFRDVPNRILSDLDTREICVPKGIIATSRNELEQVLHHYVVSYHRGIFLTTVPWEKHVCANFQGAHLTNYQKKILHAYEERVKEYNISFVVYEKSLRRIDPSMSPMAKFMHRE